LAVLLASAVIGYANPDLVPGTWKNITPAGVPVDPAKNIFCQGMAIDHRNPSTLYLGICGYDVTKNVGLYKSTDGGSNWKRVGHLDEPVHVAVDPQNSNRLYCVDGVRGNTQGFWISNDAGETWTKPAGFNAVTAAPVGTQDLYSLATEPGNFDHVLVTFHSPWNAINNAGVLESLDGGLTWAVRQPPAASAGTAWRCSFSNGRSTLSATARPGCSRPRPRGAASSGLRTAAPPGSRSTPIK
jgi:hypothetical protein